MTHDLGELPSREQGANGGRATAPTMSPAEVAALGGQIGAAVNRVLLGKPEVVRLSVIALLTGGHLLIEDVPGVGKTRLAKALARTVDASVNRVQFTPDLMPSDVTGVSVYDRQSGLFEFRPGPVFSNILVADEINRASPKTQSSLLEAMEEQQVTVDGTTYALPRPFIVMATQNPLEMEGTYPLPEAQRDRFMARISMGYPVESAEIAMLSAREGVSPIEELEPVTDAAEVRKLIEVTASVHVSRPVQEYAVALATATRRSHDLRLGASPRATLQLVRACRARAAIDGRAYVLPDDVRELAPLVLGHRLLMTLEATMAGRTAGDVVQQVLDRVPVPPPAPAAR